MGFLSHGHKGDVRPEQKWDYIGLNDFKSQSCFTPFAYAYLYFSLGLSIAVYAVDTFTAVNLLVFDRWSSEIAPTQLISFTASKWIFSVCIILSVINLAYEHIRAMRVMRRGSVAESYLDNLAVRLESVRWGKGQGWKRFLVFAELTKSKKGAEYIALFTYFSFQSWIRVLLCSGPRQVVNALTLLSVYNAQLSVTGDNVGNTLLNFFDKIRTLAEDDYQEAVILSGMIFTLVVWVFSFLSLLLAFLFFLFFLWGYIPRSDGGLSGYCSRKINKRLMKIVTSKVNTALEEEERRRKKAELKAAMKKGELPPTELTATIPNVGDGSAFGNGSTDKLPAMPNSIMLQRNDTMATLPPYTSRPGTAGGGPNGPNNNSSFELNAMDQKPRPMMPPTRSGTMASMSTLAAPTPQNPNFSARAPLLGYAAEPGRSSSPTPTLPELDGGMRPGTQNGPGGPMSPYGQPLNRTNTGGSGMPYPRQNTRNDSFSSFAGNNQYPNQMPQMPQPVRSPAGPGAYGYNNMNNVNDNRPGTANSYATNGRNNSQSGSQDFGYNYNGSNNNNANGRNNSLSSNGPRYNAYRPDDSNTGRASPAPSTRSYGPGPGPNGPNGPNGPGLPMSPMRSATNPYPVSPRNYGPPQRNMTAPMPPMNSQSGQGTTPFGHGRQISEESSYSSYFERPTTSSSQRGPGTGNVGNVSSGYAPPRRPSYGNIGNTGSNAGGAWNGDVEAQRGRY
ncbi:Potassium transporter [Sporothrix eucalyptigena]|uniref:Potassium transporter n=1 Tax=Sporothrix eucalyptigena TaxID=1812306 RepID=A0ABP0C716_9PEZI